MNQEEKVNIDDNYTHTSNQNEIKLENDINYCKLNSDENLILKTNYDFINNKNNFFFNNSNSNIYYFKENNQIYDIIQLLKTNPNISSYMYLIDNLPIEELIKTFSFILYNIDAFLTNSQSYLLIGRIISLFKSNSFNEFNETQNKINENVYSFLLSFFKKRITFLIHSSNFITCIINMVVKIGYPKNDFIYIEINNEFKTFAFNRQGCILIQNLFPVGNEIQKKHLFDKILEEYNELIVDKYGHYLFKHLLFKEAHGEKYYGLIVNKIINDIKRFTNNQFSSVVIERLLDSSDIYIRNKIIDKICKNENDVIELLYHSYGNYVLQKIIKVTKDNNLLGLIYKTVIKNKSSLYKLSYGKKIMKEISSAYTLK